MEVGILIVGDRDIASLRSVPTHVDTVVISARPERAELDAALDAIRGHRLGVLADDAGLGAVVRRLLQRDELASVPLAILGSPGVRSRYGLTGDPVRELVDGIPAAAGLVRDDHSGVTLDRAQLLPVSGSLGMRAYVEEHELVNRPVRSLSVSPGAGSLIATAAFPGRLRRDRARSGRAVTVSCAEARLVIDGAERQRTQTRCSWWYEADHWSIYR